MNDDKEQEDKIIKTIEEIAPDDKSTKEDLVEIDESDMYGCLLCGFKMILLSACRLKCPNCGSEKDCSETQIW